MGREQYSGQAERDSMGWTSHAENRMSAEFTSQPESPTLMVMNDLMKGRSP